MTFGIFMLLVFGALAFFFFGVPLLLAIFESYKDKTRIKRATPLTQRVAALLAEPGTWKRRDHDWIVHSSGIAIYTRYQGMAVSFPPLAEELQPAGRSRYDSAPSEWAVRLDKRVKIRADEVDLIEDRITDMEKAWVLARFDNAMSSWRERVFKEHLTAVGLEESDLRLQDGSQPVFDIESYVDTTSAAKKKFLASAKQASTKSSSPGSTRAHG